MGVGMKETMDQKLIAIKLDQVVNHLLNVDIVADDLIHFSHPRSFEKLHDEDAGRRDVRVHPRNDHELAVAKQLGKTLDIVCLMFEIHFFGNDAGELFDDGAGRSYRMVFNELVDDE